MSYERPGAEGRFFKPAFLHYGGCWWVQLWCILKEKLAFAWHLWNVFRVSFTWPTLTLDHSKDCRSFILTQTCQNMFLCCSRSSNSVLQICYRSDTDCEKDFSLISWKVLSEDVRSLFIRISHDVNFPRRWIWLRASQATPSHINCVENGV